MSEISETEIKSMTKEQNYLRGYKDGKRDVLNDIRAEIKQSKHYRGKSGVPAIDAHDRGRDKYFDLGLERALHIIDKYADGVSSEKKTGHWTRELIRNEYGGCIGAKMICSECGQDNGYDKRMKYCPNCGAKMVESEEVCS